MVSLKLFGSTHQKKAIGSNVDGLFIIIRALNGGDYAVDTQVFTLALPLLSQNSR